MGRKAKVRRTLETLDPELHLGDCLNILPTLPDNSVDAVVCDPPYYSTNLAFDKAPKIDFYTFLAEIKRVLKQDGLLVSFGDFNTIAKLKSTCVFKSSYEIVWQKNLPLGYLDANYRPLRNHEFIGVFYDRLKSTKYNPQKFNYQSSRFKIGELNNARKITTDGLIYGKKRNADYIEDGTRFPLTVVYSHNWDGGMIAKVRAGQKRHPTQKSIDLVEYLVKTYTNEGDTVLDPFMGAGTTGVACANLGRNFIGIEKDAEYFAIAHARIAAAQGKH